MIFYDIEQNSEDWDLIRIGKFTASMFSDLFMDKKTKGYQDAIIKIAYERVTGISEEKYSSKFMKRGHDEENIAKEAYESYTFSKLENGGFYEYSDFIGASPDGKISGENGGVEIKRPSFRIYNEYLESGKIPKDYFWQIHGQLLCTGWDFIDYMPYSHSNLRQILIRVNRDEAILNMLKSQLDESISDVCKLIDKIKR